MRTLKINWLRAGLVLSFFLLIGAFWVVKAMEKKTVKVTSQKELVVFHYASEDTSPGAFADPDNWVEGTSPSTRPCGNGENKPCEKTAIDKDDLESMLVGKSNQNILDDSSFSKRD
ncbi:hypothetical protein [Sphingobacterium prati]|uniref:hypothetical protein n=1 Tax=Sphingobacterium prati TaxID=2737006 RepID=UPI0015543B7F|nr:hypothetical protein [Sphingobacterium prati]NPE49172.1 hypothetical protein [Sphingobacterium prati]